MLVDDVPLDQLLGEYARQYARSNEITAANSLDQAVGTPTSVPGRRVCGGSSCT